MVLGGPMADRNRTLHLSGEDRDRLRPGLGNVGAGSFLSVEDLRDRVFHGDGLELCRLIPDASVNLIFADPPYPALRKQFGSRTFHISDGQEYSAWLEGYIREFRRILAPDGSLYLCGDWRGGAYLHPLLERHFLVQNRITWEREKGRGARRNWKNSHEDIWFCTLGEDYYFDVDSVKSLRRVRAPYRENGSPKDWSDGPEGAWRRTYPGNSWTDLTVPFWSMRENTDHPTQKPEKLLARIILASSRPGDLVFDPFMGSGTTAVASRKLGRRFCGAELEEEYALLVLRRLELAAEDGSIQGTIPAERGLNFLERNSGMTRRGQTGYNKNSLEVPDE
jgi:DNA modification methylase